MSFKYKEGDYIGPNNKYLLVRRTRKTSVWWGEIVCPYDGVHYEARLPDLLSGRGYLSCGCQRSKKFHKTMLDKRDITGQTFGHLTVLENDSGKTDSDNNVLRKCVCDCENHTVVYKTYYYLTHAKNPSCGCVGKEISRRNGIKNQKDLIGKHFGRLTVMRDSGERKIAPNGTMTIWECKCNCGREQPVFVTTNDLTTGNTLSCGCLRSKGEERITKILDSLEILYHNNYNIPGCINLETNSRLYVDFYLPELRIAIEYDGKQHFTYSNSGWNNYNNFLIGHKRDEIKNTFCKKEKIALIRIPYWDYDKLDTTYFMSLIESHRGGEVDELQCFSESNRQSC